MSRFIFIAYNDLDATTEVDHEILESISQSFRSSRSMKRILLKFEINARYTKQLLMIRS